MGTQNFYVKNASRVFVVFEANDENDFTGEYYDDYYFIKDQLKNDIIEYLKEIGLDVSTKFLDKSNQMYSRSYQQERLFEVDKWFKFESNDISINLTMIVRSGYYTAANLDWEVVVTINNSVFEDTTDFSVDDIEDCVECSDVESLCRLINRQVGLLIDKTEIVFSKVSSVYNHIGTFSNGEGVYRKAVDSDSKMPYMGAEVYVPDAPFGVYVNIGLAIGKTSDFISALDVLSAMPKGADPLSFEVVESDTEPTLVMELKRPLSYSEMVTLMDVTKQQAIPQLVDKVGVLYDTCRGRDDSWGDFNIDYFIIKQKNNYAAQ
jgi:hypothetical protein